MQCTVTIYVDYLLVTCKDKASMGEVVEPLKAKYHDMQEHMRVRHSFL